MELDNSDILVGSLSELLLESETAAEAEARGWEYAGHGYWKDKSGRTVGRTVDGKLIDINSNKAETDAKPTIGKSNTSTQFKRKPNDTNQTDLFAQPKSSGKPKKPTTKPTIVSSGTIQTLSLYAQYKRDPRIVDTINANIAHALFSSSRSLMLNNILRAVGVPSITKGYEFTINDIINGIDAEVTGGFYEPSDRNIYIRTDSTDAIDSAATLIDRYGIANLHKVIADAYVGDAPRGEREEALKLRRAIHGLVVIMHEALHSNDVPYINEIHELKVMQNKYKNASLGDGHWTKEDDDRWHKLFLSTANPVSHLTTEFVVEYKARQQMKLLLGKNDVIADNLVAVGYTGLLRNYFGFFANDIEHLDEYVETVWNQNTMQGRMEAMQEMCINQIDSVVDKVLKLDYYDTGEDKSVDTLDAKETSDYNAVKKMFADKVNKFLPIHILLNTGVSYQIVQDMIGGMVLDHDTDETKIRAPRNAQSIIIENYIKLIANPGKNPASPGLLSYLYSEARTNEDKLELTRIQNLIKSDYRTNYGKVLSSLREYFIKKTNFPVSQDTL